MVVCGEPGSRWMSGGGARRLTLVCRRCARRKGRRGHQAADRADPGRPPRNLAIEFPRVFSQISLVSDSIAFPADFFLAQGCVEGDEGAIREFQQTYRPIIIAYLRHAGAELDEAEEVTESLWADCLKDRPPYRPRLATYAGHASLKTWLYPLALNRLMARKRSQQGWQRLIDGGADVNRLGDTIESLATSASEAPLIALMNQALDAGFRACAPEHFVLLQLAHIDRLRMFELARMFHCSSSKIARDLTSAAATVAEATLGHARKVDPWLELTWEDFLELCRVTTPACFGLV